MALLHGRRRLLGVGAISGVALVAAVAAFALDGDDADSAAAASQTTKTAKIARRDLVESESVDGTLGYADGRAAVNHLTGIVTSLPQTGTVIKPNHRLYEVDGEGVYLLDGTAPAHRTLQQGISPGEDVRQLERNLRELALDPDKAMSVDGSWDAGTTTAVQRWQERKGLALTGSIELGRIVFLPGSRRIASIDATLGASSGTGAGASSSSQSSQAAATADVIMTSTSTRRVVMVDLETTKQRLAKQGARVTVEMPDGDDVAGRIAEVGKVASVKSEEQNADATVELTITLDDRGSALDQAPVDVLLEQRRSRNVLAIPVTGLMARQDGFAVEIVTAGSRRQVPVQTGLYTSGFVEIRGAGLREGMTISAAGV